MPIESKDIILISLGVVGSAFIALIFRISEVNIKEFSSVDIIIIITFFIALGFIIAIFYKRFGEITNALKEQENKLEEIKENLNIDRRLNRIEARVFKNG